MTPPSTPGFDTRVPNVARAYNYLLGGKEHFAADRALAEKLLVTLPEVRQLVRANRALLQRMVAYLTRAGVRRFLDIGAGLPCEGQVHEVAQQTDPDAWVVYVDYDPVVILHSQAMLMQHPQVNVINGDLRDASTILDTPEVRELLEPGEPVGLLLFAILQFVPDDEVAFRSVAELVDALPPGSYLGLSHPAVGDDAEKFTSAVRLYENTTPAGPRPRDSIARFFDGLTMVEPGLVPAGEWRATEVDEHGWHLAGLAQKT